MGHMPVDGADGSLAALAGLSGRRIYIHINNTNPILIEGSPERRRVEAAGWEVAYDGMEIAAVKLRTPDELEARLREIGARRYHRLHPFHRLPARRRLQQGPGAGLGAQPILLSGENPDEGREPDRAQRRSGAAAGMALAARGSRRRSARGRAASRAGWL